jgi:hypothetical protein
MPVRVTFGQHRLHFEHQGKKVDRSVNVLQDTEIRVSLGTD